MSNSAYSAATQHQQSIEAFLAEQGPLPDSLAAVRERVERKHASESTRTVPAAAAAPAALDDKKSSTEAEEAAIDGGKEPRSDKGKSSDKSGKGGDKNGKGGSEKGDSAHGDEKKRSKKSSEKSQKGLQLRIKSSEARLAIALPLLEKALEMGGNMSLSEVQRLLINELIAEHGIEQYVRAVPADLDEPNSYLHQQARAEPDSDDDDERSGRDAADKADKADKATSPRNNSSSTSSSLSADTADNKAHHRRRSRSPLKRLRRGDKESSSNNNKHVDEG